METAALVIGSSKWSMKDLFSIVVPIYNVEKYVKSCLASILGQSYTNLEILCIDDCGQDSSMRIVEEFAKSDKRIKIIKFFFF